MKKKNGQRDNVERKYMRRDCAEGRENVVSNYFTRRHGGTEERRRTLRVSVPPCEIFLCDLCDPCVRNYWIISRSHHEQKEGLL